MCLAYWDKLERIWSLEKVFEVRGIWFKGINVLGFGIGLIRCI